MAIAKLSALNANAINPANTKSLLVLIKRRSKVQERICHVNVL